jgi:hypothetical protein
MRNLPALLLVATLPLAACTTHGVASATARLTGDATFRDATAPARDARQPAAPPAQAMTVAVEIDGHGTIASASAERRCVADPSGAFAARYTGTAQLSSDGTYAAVLASGPGAIATPSGCPLADVTDAAVTGAKLHAELAATPANCQNYCAAKARADAESQCATSADQPSCRATARAALGAQCESTCTTRAHAIAADAELGAADLADLQASLVFDHLTDAAGARL